MIRRLFLPALVVISATLWLCLVVWYLFSSAQFPIHGTIAIGIAGLLGILITASLLASREWQVSAVVTGVASILALFIAEFTYVAVEGKSTPYLSDIKDRLAAFEALRSNGVETIFHMPLRATAKHPAPYNLAGKSNTKVVTCRESEGVLIIDSDRHGFNNPPDVWEKNVVNVVLGDSFAEGWCVPVENSISRLIARNSRAGALLNLAYAGHGPLEALGALIEFGVQYRPRHVLWFYFEGNDIADLERGIGTPLLGYLENTGYRQDLANRQDEIDRLLRSQFEAEYAEHVSANDNSAPPAWGGGMIPPSVMSMLRLSKLRTRLGLTSASAFGGQLSKNTLSKLARVARRMHEVVRSWNGELTIVYLPYLGSLQGQPAVIQNQKRIINTFNKQGIRVINATSLLSKHKLVDIFGLAEFGGHYSSKGHALVSDLVVNRISDR